MPLCNNAKILTNNDIYRRGEVTGTALLINRTNLVVIDIDNKGKTIDERKEIFKKICEHFLPSPNSDKKDDCILRDYLYAEQTASYGLHIILSATYHMQKDEDGDDCVIVKSFTTDDAIDTRLL